MNQIYIGKNEDAQFDLKLVEASRNSGYPTLDATETPVEVHLPGASNTTVVLSTANAGEIVLSAPNNTITAKIAPAKSNLLNVAGSQVISVLITKSGKTYLLTYEGKLDVQTVPNP